MPSLLFCPICKTTYQDETLIFCLNDGTKLVPLGNNAGATVQLPSQTNPSRFNIPNSEPTVQANTAAPPLETQKGRSAKLLVGLLIIGFLAIIAIAGAVGAYFVFNNQSSVATTTPTPIASPSPANNIPANASNSDKSDSSTRELEEKLNKLEKQLEAQKQANKTNSSPSQTQNPASLPTAKVNSPNDGFLALRSEPNTETGTQILKIPHGATVLLNNCEKNTIKVGGRTGRWCDVEYAERSGYVFSAWLNF